MSGTGKRSLMQVEPTKLVELAESSESTLAAMQQDWALAIDQLAGACADLGDADGMRNIAASYADSLTDAGETLAALSGALGQGVAGLIDAARDAVRADDTVAGELDRAVSQIITHEFDRTPQPGGR
ncbi:hypothetical protein EUA93_09335 [Nocardioides oleivorans]|uniref:Uncharacterized protein n=1 Tax=Nocardioides oleivorans TaxID=273676 RepID=A0A4Q2RZG2_9ACTN|nr:hypothetical protein [Nocardioides oleivorans]RYB94528.1 hypothetical protein EUA93_09335 [Nocardioides oleivorans]